MATITTHPNIVTGSLAGWNLPIGMNNVFIGYNSSSNTTTGTLYNPFENLNIKSILFNNIESIKLIKYKNGDKEYNILGDLLTERTKLSKKYNKILKQFDIFAIRKTNINNKLFDNDKKVKNIIDHFLENKSKDIIEIHFEPTFYTNTYDNCIVLFKNGVIHSTKQEAIKLESQLSPYVDTFYFINGKYYSHDEWIKHPIKISEERRLKIKKLFN